MYVYTYVYTYLVTANAAFVLFAQTRNAPGSARRRRAVRQRRHPRKRRSRLGVGKDRQLLGRSGP